MDNLIKIFGTLNKPYHYFMVGLFLVGWKYFFGSEENLYFWGGISIVISLASLIEKIFYFINKKIIEYNVKKQEKEKIAKLKQYYITEYNNMNEKEKLVINHCLLNRTLTYTSPLFSNEKEVAYIYSLVGKRFGQNVTYGGDFMMDQYCYEVLSRYLNDKGINND